MSGALEGACEFTNVPVSVGTDRKSMPRQLFRDKPSEFIRGQAQARKRRHPKPRNGCIT